MEGGLYVWNEHSICFSVINGNKCFIALHVCFSLPQYRDPVTRGGGVVPLHTTPRHSRCGTKVRSFYDKLQKLKYFLHFLNHITSLFFLLSRLQDTLLLLGCTQCLPPHLHRLWHHPHSPLFHLPPHLHPLWHHSLRPLQKVFHLPLHPLIQHRQMIDFLWLQYF